MREPTGPGPLRLAAVAVTAFALPLGVYLLLHSRLALPWILLPVGLTVAVRMLDQRYGRRHPWLGGLSSLVVVAFGAMLVSCIVITPYSAYRVWFESVRLGTPRGAVSTVFVLAAGFFSSLLSPTLLTMGVAWTLVVLGLTVLYLLAVILPSPFVFLLILLLMAGSLAILAARTRGIGSGRASQPILLLAAALTLAFVFAGDRQPQGSRIIDQAIYPGIRNLVVSLFPGFPLVYEIPGYGYSFNQKQLGGRPTLSDNPIFTVEGTPGEALYLRTRVFDYYNGRSWKISIPEYEAVLGRAGRRLFSSRFSGEPNLRITLAVDFYNSLPHTLDTWHIGFAREMPGISQGNPGVGYLMEPPLQFGDTILVNHGQEPAGLLPRGLPTGSGGLPANQQARYRQLPEELPEDVRLLAARLARGEQSPEAVLGSIQRYLAANYVYNLNPREPREPRDFVEGFLFGGDFSGYCVHFASSFIILARLNGIPARYATGFLVYIPDSTSRATVTGMAAHAWPEVWLEDRGWVAWEATTAVDPAAYRRTPGSLIYEFRMARDPLTSRQIAGLMGSRVEEAVVTADAGSPPPAGQAGPPLPRLALPAGAALLFLLAAWLRRDALRAFLAGRQGRLDYRLDRTLRRMRRAGLPDPRASGWLAWFRALEGRLPPAQRRIASLRATVLAQAYGRQAAVRDSATLLRQLEQLARELPRAPNR